MVQNSARRVVIILHSARRVVKSYYTTTSCTNEHSALNPEETREDVRFLETECSSADLDMKKAMAYKLVSG